MKPKRVDCADCDNFRDYYIKKHKCRLGKRVMFRSKSHPDLSDYEAGWPRYCNYFKQKVK